MGFIALIIIAETILLLKVLGIFDQKNLKYANNIKWFFMIVNES